MNQRIVGVTEVRAVGEPLGRRVEIEPAALHDDDVAAASGEVPGQRESCRSGSDNGDVTIEDGSSSVFAQIDQHIRHHTQRQSKQGAAM